MSDTKENTPAAFYAVILQTDGAFLTEQFDTAEALAARLKELINRDVSVSCFMGSRLHISKPPTRYLITPTGNIPLFEPEAQIEPDDTGYLGMDPIHFENPPQIKMPQQIKPAANADEFFNDDSDDIVNVFDKILPDPDA
jgi:hypothetical protein